MPSKQEIQAEITRLKNLPETPSRLREIKALERCLGMEIKPIRATKTRGSTTTRRRNVTRSQRDEPEETPRRRDNTVTRTGPHTFRRRAPLVEDEHQDEEKREKTPRKSDFNAKNYLGDLLGNHHDGMA